MRRLQVDGAGIDAGPTVFTMRWVFEQILAAAGFSLADLPALTPLDGAGPPRLARPRARGWTCSPTASARPRRSASSPAPPRRGASSASAAQAQRGLRSGSRARTSARSGPTLLSHGRRPRPARPGHAGRPRPVRLDLWRALARHFHDPRLQQLFGRYATYCGSSPCAAPATLMLVAQVELDGVWSVDGGMHARRAGLRRAGAAARRDASATPAPASASWSSGGRVRGVRLAGGEELAADSVVFNGDAAGPGRRACSATARAAAVRAAAARSSARCRR